MPSCVRQSHFAIHVCLAISLLSFEPQEIQSYCWGSALLLKLKVSL